MCPNYAQSYARFKEAAVMMNKSLCQPIALLPPFHGGPLHLSWGHLPYFNLKAYLQQLSKYVCDLPSQSALMVWGLKSTGKSLGLQAMVELWQKQGRIVMLISRAWWEATTASFTTFGTQSSTPSGA